MKRFVLVLSALAVSISAFAQREYARELLEQDVTRSMNLHHNYEAPEKVVDTPAPKGYKPFYISHYATWVEFGSDEGIQNGVSPALVHMSQSRRIRQVFGIVLSGVHRELQRRILAG